jgi:hypothetical protein
MSAEITFKRGDTIAFDWEEYWDVDMTQLRDLTNVTVACWAEHETGTRKILNVTVIDATSGKLHMVDPASVSSPWLIGIWTVDVEFSEAGAVNSSPSWQIRIERDITNAQ